MQGAYGSQSPDEISFEYLLYQHWLRIYFQSPDVNQSLKIIMQIVLNLH